MIPKKSSTNFKEVQKEKTPGILQKKRITASQNKITVEDPIVERERQKPL